MESGFILALVASVLGVSVLTDVRLSRIPNALTFPAMSIAVLAHGVLAGAEGFYFSLTGLVSGFIFFLVLSLLGPMGAGDVKLMGTIGALIGPYGAVMAGILSLMVGGLYALGVMWLQRALSNPPPKLRLHAQGPISPPGTGTALRLRYGVAIAAGTALFLMGVHPFGG